MPSLPLSTEARRFVRLARAEVAKAEAEMRTVLGGKPGEDINEVLARYADALRTIGPRKMAAKITRLSQRLRAIDPIMVIDRSYSSRRAGTVIGYPQMGGHPLALAQPLEPDTITLMSASLQCSRSRSNFAVARVIGAVSAHVLGRVAERTDGSVTPQSAARLVGIATIASLILATGRDEECSIALRITPDQFLVGVLREGWQDGSDENGEPDSMRVCAADWRTYADRHMLPRELQAFGDALREMLYDGRKIAPETLPQIPPREDYIRRMIEAAQ